MIRDLSRWIETHAAFTPEKPAIRYEDEIITYGVLRNRIQSVGSALRYNHNIRHGDRVAHLGFNAPDMLVLLFACARIGAMFLPLNWRLARPELEYILSDASPAILLTDRAHQDMAQGLARTVVTTSALQAGGETEAKDTEAAGSPEDPVLLVYTSGTTGRPKGAVLDQRALLCNTLNAIDMHGLTAADHVLTVLPMFHVGGLNIQTVPALYAGATVTLHRVFDASATLAAIARDRPDLTVLVPATIAALIADPGWRNTDLSSLRAVTTGSSIVPTPLLRAFIDRGVPAIQVYGLTESGPVATYQRIQDAATGIGTVGRAALHTDIRIVDRTGLDVPANVAGEIWLKGANLLSGYWRNPAATSAALIDGWLRTGDIGVRDDVGVVTIKDRMSDVVISGGENIYPAELEAVLNGIAGIAEAVVIGCPDAHWGEVPVAVVVCAPGHAMTESAVTGAFEGVLARFKHPKAVIFADSLPRNAMGKVQKRALRDQITAGALQPARCPATD